MSRVLSIANQTARRLPRGARQLMEGAARAAVEAASDLASDRVRVDVTVVSDAELRELSRRYLGTDHYTDVMSFSQLEPAGSAATKTIHGGGPRRQLLGDVVISLERAADNAAELGHSTAVELALLAAHGVLHLLGHHDADPEGQARMRRLERMALEAAGVAAADLPAPFGGADV